jgi:hypothetical protein
MSRYWPRVNELSNRAAQFKDQRPYPSHLPQRASALSAPAHNATNAAPGRSKAKADSSHDREQRGRFGMTTKALIAGAARFAKNAAPGESQTTSKGQSAESAPFTQNVKNAAPEDSRANTSPNARARFFGCRTLCGVGKGCGFCTCLIWFAAWKLREIGSNGATENITCTLLRAVATGGCRCSAQRERGMSF